MKRLLVLLVVCVTLCGCETYGPAPNDPRYAPVVPISPQPPKQSVGSIYATGAGISLWEDQRARRIGDIITLILDERTISTKSSSSSVSKKDDNTMGVTSLLGATPSIGLPGVFNTQTDLTLDSNTSNDRKFEGSSGADQSNRLQGSISVTVVDVLSNGILVIRGEKWITLTSGDEFIRIEGLLRPSDVRPDNSALSTRVADARITYSGRGELADANKKGWLSRFFSSPMWPF